MSCKWVQQACEKTLGSGGEWAEWRKPAVTKGAGASLLHWLIAAIGGIGLVLPEILIF